MFWKMSQELRNHHVWRSTDFIALPEGPPHDAYEPKRLECKSRVSIALTRPFLEGSKCHCTICLQSSPVYNRNRYVVSECMKLQRLRCDWLATARLRDATCTPGPWICRDLPARHLRCAPAHQPQHAHVSVSIHVTRSGAIQKQSCKHIYCPCPLEHPCVSKQVSTREERRLAPSHLNSIPTTPIVP